MHSIILYVIDIIHNIRCLEPFLPLYDHFEILRFLGPDWQYQLKPCRITNCKHCMDTDTDTGCTKSNSVCWNHDFDERPDHTEPKNMHSAFLRSILRSIQLLWNGWKHRHRLPGSVKIPQKAVPKLLQKQQRRTGEKYILFLLKCVSCTLFVKSSTDGIAFSLSHCTIPEEKGLLRNIRQGKGPWPLGSWIDYIFTFKMTSCKPTKDAPDVDIWPGQ